MSEVDTESKQDGSSGTPSGDDATALQARIEALEAENERLKAEAAEPHRQSTGRGRNAGAISLAIVAALLMALSVPAVWLNRMVTDTDVYVATVAPLAKDVDIQNAVANAASEAVVEKLDAQTRVSQLLPDNLSFIAAPVAQAVNGFIEKEAFVLVRSDHFAKTWEEVNRASHKALVTALTGRDTGAVGVEAGVITLDVGVLADQLKTRLTDAGLGFAASIPTAGISKQIVLYESPVLAQLSVAFDLIARVALWLPLLGLAFAAGAIGLAADRRKAILWLGGALAIGAILPLQTLFLGQTYVAGQLTQLVSIPTPAAQAAFDIIFRDLVTADRATAALGIALWFGAILAGPATWAVAMRSGLSGGLSGVASHLELGRFGVWVRARKGSLRWVGAGIAFLILASLPAPRTVASIVWLTSFWVLWLLVVELLGAEPGTPSPTEVGESEEVAPRTESPA
jgi:hypothetical protein